MARQDISEAKLIKIIKLNDKLKQQLELQRIPVSEASRSLIEYCQTTNDMLLPSIWGNKHPDPFNEPVNGCGASCTLM